MYLYIIQEPVKIVLGTDQRAKGLGAERRLIEEEESLMYVPVLETLQALLNDETILAEVRSTDMHICSL